MSKKVKARAARVQNKEKCPLANNRDRKYNLAIVLFKYLWLRDKNYVVVNFGFCSIN